MLKKIVCLIVSVVMCGSVFAGCNLVTFDQERDDAKVVMTIGSYEIASPDGKSTYVTEEHKIYKNEFLNYIHGPATDKAQTAAYRAQVIETKAREFQKFVEQYYNQNMKNIYNKYVQGIIPPQIGITDPLPVGVLKNIP